MAKCGSPSLRRAIFLTVLRPLILRNYHQREHGKRPDKWYWADKLALSWGMFV